MERIRDSGMPFFASTATAEDATSAAPPGHPKLNTVDQIEHVGEVMGAGVQKTWQACKTGRTGLKPDLKPRGRRVKPLKPVDFKRKNNYRFFF